MTSYSWQSRTIQIEYYLCLQISEIVKAAFYGKTFYLNTIIYKIVKNAVVYMRPSSFEAEKSTDSNGIHIPICPKLSLIPFCLSCVASIRNILYNWIIIKGTANKWKKRRIFYTTVTENHFENYTWRLHLNKCRIHFVFTNAQISAYYFLEVSELIKWMGTRLLVFPFL